ncbi:MAG: hypothetical protein JSV10_01445 [Candidatus Zixiibacteriota bacterium]|nr:MAG: hypothetical protein JSV10_01445 [candidate division Zixibacteria bacterium]
MLIAVGVASYSFSKKYMARTQNPDGALSDTVAFSCGVTLSSLKALDVVAADEEAVFVILPGGSEEASRNALRQIDAVVRLLSDQGKKVAAFTLEKHREGYDHLVKQFSVKSFPCVVVAGRGCGSVAVSGQITETKLLAALVQASMPPSSCATPCVPSGSK